MFVILHLSCVMARFVTGLHLHNTKPRILCFLRELSLSSSVLSLLGEGKEWGEGEIMGTTLHPWRVYIIFIPYSSANEETTALISQNISTWYSLKHLYFQGDKKSKRNSVKKKKKNFTATKEENWTTFDQSEDLSVSHKQQQENGCWIQYRFR